MTVKTENITITITPETGFGFDATEVKDRIFDFLNEQADDYYGDGILDNIKEVIAKKGSTVLGKVERSEKDWVVSTNVYVKARTEDEAYNKANDAFKKGIDFDTEFAEVC